MEHEGENQHRVDDEEGRVEPPQQDPGAGTGWQPTGAPLAGGYGDEEISVADGAEPGVEIPPAETG